MLKPLLLSSELITRDRKFKCLTFLLFSDHLDPLHGPRLITYDLRQCFSTFLSSRHTLHQKRFGGTPKNSKIKKKKTSKSSCFALNKLKLAIGVQSNCPNYHLQTTKSQLMHTGFTGFLNIGSKISKSNREKFGGTLCSSSRHTG
jgi:hypothetical protein